jgi:hypothetical protein
MILACLIVAAFLLGLLAAGAEIEKRREGTGDGD